jgi:hypothetical protein
MGDGWSSVNNHPLLNIMCVSPIGEEFLGAIDTSRHTKDAIYIANVMKRYLAKVGPKNVVQICTDNASVIVKPFVLYKRIGRTYTSKDAWLMH